MLDLEIEHSWPRDKLRSRGPELLRTAPRSEKGESRRRVGYETTSRSSKVVLLAAHTKQRYNLRALCEVAMEMFPWDSLVNLLARPQRTFHNHVTLVLEAPCLAC